MLRPALTPAHFRGFFGSRRAPALGLVALACLGASGATASGRVASADRMAAAHHRKHPPAGMHVATINLSGPTENLELCKEYTYSVTIVPPRSYASLWISASAGEASGFYLRLPKLAAHQRWRKKFSVMYPTRLSIDTGFTVRGWLEVDSNSKTVFSKEFPLIAAPGQPLRGACVGLPL